MKVTPENITNLEPNQIFVFGANEAGRHGAGAARTARHLFGAIPGQGSGLAGQSYGISTKDTNLRVLSLEQIAVKVRGFLLFARAKPELHFLVTPIGCGLAGYDAAQIAPMFKDCPPNVSLPASFWAVLGVVENEP